MSKSSQEDFPLGAQPPPLGVGRPRAKSLDRNGPRLRSASCCRNQVVGEPESEKDGGKVQLQVRNTFLEVVGAPEGVKVRPRRRSTGELLPSGGLKISRGVEPQHVDLPFNGTAVEGNKIDSVAVTAVPPSETAENCTQSTSNRPISPQPASHEDGVRSWMADTPEIFPCTPEDHAMPEQTDAGDPVMQAILIPSGGFRIVWPDEVQNSESECSAVACQSALPPSVHRIAKDALQDDVKSAPSQSVPKCLRLPEDPQMTPRASPRDVLQSSNTTQTDQCRKDAATDADAPDFTDGNTTSEYEVTDDWVVLQDGLDEIVREAKVLHYSLNSISDRLARLPRGVAEASASSSKSVRKVGTQSVECMTETTGETLERWKNAKAEMELVDKEKARIVETKAQTEADLERFRLQTTRAPDREWKLARKSRRRHGDNGLRPAENVIMPDEAERLWAEAKKEEMEESKLREELRNVQSQLKGERGFLDRKVQELELKIKHLGIQNSKLEAEEKVESDPVFLAKVAELQEQNRLLSQQVQERRAKSVRAERALRCELQAAQRRLARAEEGAARFAETRLAAQQAKNAAMHWCDRVELGEAEMRAATEELQVSKVQERGLEAAVAPNNLGQSTCNQEWNTVEPTFPGAAQRHGRNRECQDVDALSAESRCAFARAGLQALQSSQRLVDRFFDTFLH